MSSKYRILFFIGSFLAMELFGQQDDQLSAQVNSCGQRPHPNRVTMRHIEANGIGYNQGYTTLEGFFAVPEPWKASWLPFLDLRGHLFNNGKPAANAGLGMRYLTSRVWGANVYYDYRKTTHHSYSQIALGLESLGRKWDFRLNGYLPVGDRTSHRFDLKFRRFQNHYSYLSYKREFALKGANAEIGVHVTPCKQVPLYFAAGPYYLSGHGKTAWGGEARLAVNIFDWVRLEGNTSYDSLFKWIGQGQLSVIIPYGTRKKIWKTKTSSCSEQLDLAARSLQQVDRQEIIPVDKKSKTTKAINPATGQPYYWWFVNNTSHSAGTFESPFNNLTAAQNASSANDVIYFFPGDGTTTGSNTGLRLKDNQRFFGAGTPQKLPTTIGTVTIPAQANGMPLITNSNNPVISCAHHNEISGIYILANAPASTPIFGIHCEGITDVFVHHNRFDVSGFTSPNNVGLFLNCGGIIIVENNFFNTTSDFTKAIQIYNSTNPNTIYRILSNIFSCPPPRTGDPNVATGIELGEGGGSVAISHFNTMTIANNQFIDLGNILDGSKPIGGFGFGGSGTLNLNNNLFLRTGAGTNDGAHSTVLLRIQAGGNLVMNIMDNRWENSKTLTAQSLRVLNKSTTARACVNLTNNLSDVNPSNTAYSLNNTVGGVMTTQVQNNVGVVAQTATIPGSCP